MFHPLEMQTRQQCERPTGSEVRECHQPCRLGRARRKTTGLHSSSMNTNNTTETTGTTDRNTTDRNTVLEMPKKMRGGQKQKVFTFPDSSSSFACGRFRDVSHEWLPSIQTRSTSTTKAFKHIVRCAKKKSLPPKTPTCISVTNVVNMSHLSSLPLLLPTQTHIQFWVHCSTKHCIEPILTINPIHWTG